MPPTTSQKSQTMTVHHNRSYDTIPPAAAAVAAAAAAAVVVEEYNTRVEQEEEEEEEHPVIIVSRREFERWFLFAVIVLLLMFVHLSSLGHKILNQLHHHHNYNYKDHNHNDNDIAAQSLLHNKKEIHPTMKLHKKPSTTSPVSILIVYGPSDDKYQKLMAEHVKLGAEQIVPSTQVTLKTIDTVDYTTDVLRANAVILGSSVQNTNTHPAVQTWINRNWKLRDRTKLQWTIGAAFVTAGGISAGEEGTLQSLLHSMMIFGFIVLGGPSWESVFGASAITYEQPYSTHNDNDDDNDDSVSFFPTECQSTYLVHPVFLHKARGLGERVASVATVLHSAESSQF